MSTFIVTSGSVGAAEITEGDHFIDLRGDNFLIVDEGLGTFNWPSVIQNPNAPITLEISGELFESSINGVPLPSFPPNVFVEYGRFVIDADGLLPDPMGATDITDTGTFTMSGFLAPEFGGHTFHGQGVATVFWCGTECFRQNGSSGISYEFREAVAEPGGLLILAFLGAMLWQRVRRWSAS